MSCEHDKRFKGVFDLPKSDGGCLACALERESAEVSVLREGLCDIAKTAIKEMNPTYGDMATDCLKDANAISASTVQEPPDA